MRADEDLSIAVSKQTIVLCFPRFWITQVANWVLEKFVERDSLQISPIPLLVPNQKGEITWVQVARFIGEVGMADHRHTGHFDVAPKRAAMRHLNGHVTDVRTHGGTLVSPGIFPGNIRHVQTIFAGQRLNVCVGYHLGGFQDRFLVVVQGESVASDRASVFPDFGRGKGPGFGKRQHQRGGQKS